MTTVIRVLDPSCAAIQAVLHDKAAVVANGRDVGFIRNAAAHSIGLNVFAVLAAPQHHERLEDLAKSFKVFPDMKDIRVNSQLLLAATSRIALLISSANKSTYDSQLKCDESKQKASSANHKKARNIYTKRTDLGAAITEEKFNEILALVQTDSCTAELKQKLKDRGIPEDDRTSRLVTEGELARVAAEAHARGFASGAAAGSAHGLVKGMEIGASVASKTVACLADRFVDLENKIEKSGQAVLKAVEHSSNETLEAVEEVREAVEKSGQEVLKAVEQSSNETLEAVEEVREAVEETRSELKEGFQGVADAFMRLEESLFNGLDALEDRQAELRKAEEDRQAELRKAERAVRREISAGEAQRHAALYSKVSEIAASMSGAVMSAGFDAGVEKKKPEEATMEVADGEAKRVAKRQASAEANSVKRLKEASRERSHILPFTARRSFATPPLSPLSKAKANRGL
eukprot:jgi/Chrpa1/16394/Chrysochromulina_OHIO_Genome00005182-RA